MRVNGFELEVWEDGGKPHVRISFPDGREILTVNTLSVTGLQNIAPVFEAASRLAVQELEDYWKQREREDIK